jgi:hypothetical protein
MTSSIDLFEKALQAPTMEAVIALSEKVQTLEAKPEGVVYTVYRPIDQTLLIGYTENLAATTIKHQQRGFELMEARRGTRREERLLLLTLKEIGVQSSYCEGCFDAEVSTLAHFHQLGWPLGRLRSLCVSKNTRERFHRS